jgi:molybdopterin molybdotransferase
VLTPERALRRILASASDVTPLPCERVTLSGALGRALAEDLRATADLPAFDASTMDGYALRAADARSPGARLPVAFEVFAGAAPPEPLPAGECCRIYTGAALPEGADAVEMQERVRRSGRVARFERAAERGRFIRARASEFNAGSVAVPAGTFLDPGMLGLVAALGHGELAVVRRPRVAILPTGDELVPFGAPLAPGKIYESNSHALAAAVVEAGGEPVLLPVARDDARALARGLEAARGCDVLITNGGVSVGARDLVRSALEAAGARASFWRVAMRPGKPFTYGRWDRALTFGLPGNPASALVTFEIFARPAIRALGGLRGHGRISAFATLSAAQEKPAELEVYLRVRLKVGEDGLVAEPLRTQLSGHLTSAAGHDALAVLPAGPERFARGSRVAVRILRAPEP